MLSRSHSECGECSKKFSLLSKKRKCKHCMTPLCKNCVDAHTQSKHPSVASAQAARSELVAGSRVRRVQISEQERVFQSPTHSTSTERSDPEYRDLLGDMDDVVTVEDEDDDDDEAVEEDDDDDEDEAHREVDDGEDDLFLGKFTRRASIEEEASQYVEFVQIQAAVTAWTKKEMEIKKQQRLAKRNSCYAMTPIPNVHSTRQHQHREIFTVTYSMFVTLLVWGIYGFTASVYYMVHHRCL